MGTIGSDLNVPNVPSVLKTSPVEVFFILTVGPFAALELGIWLPLMD
jgi:hypothetical protein